MNAVTTRRRTARRISRDIAVATSAGLALAMASAALVASADQGTTATVSVPAESEWTISTTEVQGEESGSSSAGSSASADSSASAGSYSGTDPRSIARAMVAARGWSSGQFDCLNALWTKESNWDPYAQNPSSGAYGIPQALPGSKMGTVAGDWRTNPETQITWGLNYIAGRYGTPCAAWSHSQAVNWY